jgi:hypothetical protein
MLGELVLVASGVGVLVTLLVATARVEAAPAVELVVTVGAVVGTALELGATLLNAALVLLGDVLLIGAVALVDAALVLRAGLLAACVLGPVVLTAELSGPDRLPRVAGEIGWVAVDGLLVGRFEGVLGSDGSRVSRKPTTATIAASKATARSLPLRRGAPNASSTPSGDPGLVIELNSENSSATAGSMAVGISASNAGVKGRNVGGKSTLRNVSATCAAAGRAAGSAAVIERSRAGHGCGRSSGISGERSSLAMTASRPEPSKERTQVRASIMTRPRAYTSASGPTSAPRACSGAR